MDRSKLGIVIPALNEEKSIASVVAAIRTHGIPVVVDDGSTDQTAHFATIAGAVVISHTKNHGYDKALNSGFAMADELNCEFVLTLDADGQHSPDLLPLFINALDQGADVVIGVRDRRPRLAENVFAIVALLRWRIRDPLCGLKAYRMNLYRELGHFDSYSSIGTELSIFAARKKRKIIQISFDTRHRVDEPRFGKSLSANIRIIRSLIIAMFA